uniref:Chaperone DnaJ C-terminal domain-containing protein n=1 Tax=Fagus sylvatica TaxID=28930 RepID=A0A2N9FHA7_FAGSY
MPFGFLHILRIDPGLGVVMGLVLESRSLPFAGVDNDETIKVSRSGGADPDGNQPGDLYVVIKVREDPVFRREGADIHVDAVLSITQVMMLSNVFFCTY